MSTQTSLSLLAMIENFEETPDNHPGLENVRIYWGTPEARSKVRRAILNMSTENRVLFLKKFCFCWQWGLENYTGDNERNNKYNRGQIRELFGNAIDDAVRFLSPRLLFTKVARKTELRCWHCPPDGISRVHAESNGSGCLFSVEKTSSFVPSEYDELLPEHPDIQPKITLPNGSLLYGIIVAPPERW